MNTIENNKLIAEFMGYRECPMKLYRMDDKFESVTIYSMYQDEDEYLTIEAGKKQVKFSPNEMEFHTSWDWLMPVVEKIEYAHDCFVTITLVHAEITNMDLGQRDTPLNDPIFDIEADGKTKHEAIYKAVLKFIKRYNENK